MESIIDKLLGGDMRSIGQSNEVVVEVMHDPSLFPELFHAMLNPDPIVRMRAADAVEKITSHQPELLQPYKTVLIKNVATIDQQEVRWHVAQMLPRLVLDQPELQTVFQILLDYTRAKSSIVRAFAMQALVDITESQSELRAQVLGLMETLMYDGTPAMKTRGTKLLKKMKNRKPGKDEHTS